MFEINRGSNLKYIKPLFVLATVFAILPPYDFKINRFSYGFKYKIQRIVVISCLLLGFVYTFMDKIEHMQPLLQNTVVVVNYLAFVSYFLINITTVLSGNFYNYEKLEELLEILVAIDKKMINYHKNKGTSNKTYLKTEMFFGFALLFCGIFFDCTLWTRASSGIVHFYLIYESLQKVQTHVMMYVICNFMSCIRHRYRDTNKLMVDIVSKMEIESLNSKLSCVKVKRDYTVKTAIKTCIGLNKMIECINRLYGWTLLCLNINIIATLLLCFDFIIEYTSESNILKERNGASFIFLMLLWSVFSLVLGIILASLAHSTVSEIQNISHVSYKLLLRIPYDTINPLQQEMREDLMLLSEQMSLRTPNFSAAGFFNIDYTMLFTLLSSITSYLVVLIQFN